MRKLLQSKLAVAGLVAIAALYGAMTWIPMARKHPLPVAARGPELPPPPSGEPVRLLTRPRLTAESQLSEWPDWLRSNTVQRDPFRPVVIPIPTLSAQDMSPAPPAFILRGISMSAGRNLVVLNHRILAVGEELLGYTLEKIEPRQITLLGPAGRLIVGMPSSAATTQSSAKAPRPPFRGTNTNR